MFVYKVDFLLVLILRVLARVLVVRVLLTLRVIRGVAEDVRLFIVRVTDLVEFTHDLLECRVVVLIQTVHRDRVIDELVAGFNLHYLPFAQRVG